MVLGAIVMGTRSSGVALGLWGGSGVAVLVFVFGLAPGSPPVDALLIIMTVVTASSLMQAAGGIDWMVFQAARLISRNPKQIVLVGPLVSFLFAVGAGTSNILYPLLPIIADLSQRNGIRPSRALSLSVVSTGVALACSPVSAAMAAMVTLTDVTPFDFSISDILKVTLPAAIIGIILASFVVRRLGAEMDADPEIQAYLAAEASRDAGAQAPEQATSVDALTYTKEGRNSALIFLLGVLTIVMFGLFDQLQPTNGDGDKIGMTPIIEMVMLVTGTVILMVGRPKVSTVPTMSVFKAGLVSAIALLGIAWLTDTFILEHTVLITDTVGGWVESAPWIFLAGVFIVCVLTTSQSTATRTIVPIGLAAGLAPALLSGMWAAAFAGIYVLPTNGSQIAAANFDQTGSTKLGTKLVDHSFFIPAIVLVVTTAIPGMLIGQVLS